MEIIRKSLKAYIIALGLFLLLTLALAALLNFTAFREGWTFVGLVFCLAVPSLLLGILEGKIVGKKGLFVGLAASALFLLLILFAAGGVFAGSFGVHSFHASYIIPLLLGGAGGILGSNSGKS